MKNKELNMLPEMKLMNKLDEVIASNNQISVVEIFTNNEGKKIIQICLKNKDEVKEKQDIQVSEIRTVLKCVKGHETLNNNDEVIIRIYDYVEHQEKDFKIYLRLGLILSKEVIIETEWDKLGIDEIIELGEKIIY